MTNESANPSSTINDLVDSFLNRLSNTCKGAENNNQSLKEELMHEMDDTISNYLDENELLSMDFADLQQELINTVAQKLTDASNATENTAELNTDNEGNYNFAAVFEALENHTLNTIDLTLTNHDELPLPQQRN